MMGEIFYNVTVKPDQEIQKEWLQWMREEHIPDVMQTGCFTEALISRMRIPTGEDGDSYTIQYRCQDMRTLQRYQAQFAPALQQVHTERYNDKFVAFRTVSEVVGYFHGGVNLPAH